MYRKLTRRDLLKVGAIAGLGSLVGGNPLVNTVSRAAETTLSQAMTTAATAFLNALTAAQKTKATYPFTDAERFRWHWTTNGGFPRNGLPLRDMTAAQKTLAFALLRASASESGYQKTLDIISLQKELSGDPELYFVTIFGTPGSTTPTVAPWGWRFEGHHISRNFVVNGDKVSVAPFFVGAWPTATDAGLKAMEREENAARELVRSLDTATRATAIFQTNTLTQHVTWNEKDVKPLTTVGVAYAKLSTAQQGLVDEIIQTYLKNLPESIATEQLARIDQAGRGEVRFGWAGPTEPRRPHYYRLQGQTFLLEFDCSRNGGTHIHSVWRDFAQDWGYHLL